MGLWEKVGRTLLLEGKLALVTGGGQGIGRGIVERFVEEGARVVVVQRKPIDESLAQRGDIQSLQTDLADPTVMPEVVDEAAQLLGGLDILVNNAGMMFERSPAELTVKEWDLMMALNMRAPMFLTQGAIPYLERRGGGSIINIGSIEGLGSNAGHAAYSASKAGVHGLTRALAVDLGEQDIRVNSIAPGWIDSALSEEYLDSMPDPQQARAKLTRLHPLGHTGSPRDIGDVAVFLAGPQSGFITGETIVVDGGRAVRLSTPEG